VDYVKAWKDPLYRAALPEAERHSLPPNPAGIVELTDGELNGADGGTWTITTITVPITAYAGCFTVNNSMCNGTCAFETVGCCG
jgi:mersacidin/lichenicidin family type 2 lantibiotic